MKGYTAKVGLRKPRAPISGGNWITVTTPEGPRRAYWKWELR